MTKTMDLEARLWRSACRPAALEEALAEIAGALAERFPLSHLVVLRLEDGAERLRTVAAVGAPSAAPPPPGGGRTDLSSRTRSLLADWATHAGLTPARALPSGLEDALRPAGLTGDLLAAPLSPDGGPEAVLLLAAHDPPGWRPEDVSALTPLVEPVLVAYANRQRQEELLRSREALQADRAALLSRLQRQDIAEVVIGAAGGLRGVMARVTQVCGTEAPVLILGETGSGKEVIARALHAGSRRGAGPVVRVNCGAIPPGLVDSELFGHERGAFTGAVSHRRGWFERADGGTLFLDEIGELPAAAQVRLLRVLQDGTLERVGGSRTVQVDVRVVAATHRDLPAMVAAGSFREDLWYRLSVFPIRLPALRERHEDIPALAAHFAESAGRRLGGAGLSVSADEVALLRSYDWPGNVRELAAVIERAAILGGGRHLELAAALGVSTTSARARPPAETPPCAPGDSAPFGTLDDAQRAHVERALRRSRGRIEGPAGAARLLAVNPHTLRAKMRRLGIDWRRFRV